jgi:hypothetical protein
MEEDLAVQHAGIFMRLALIALAHSKLGHACLIDVELLRLVHGIAEEGNEVINILDIIVSLGILNVSKILTSSLVYGPRNNRTGSDLSFDP